MPTRDQIIQNAVDNLGIPYRWGGFGKLGEDCSAYVSRVWGTAQRHTTDTLSQVTDEIRKDDLLPGDALNLPTWRDPSGAGHVRIFGGWATSNRSHFVAYEQTSATGQSVKRVIPYDDAYTPIRLRGVEDISKITVPQPDTSNGAPPAGEVPITLQPEPSAETDPLETPADANPITRVALSITQVAQSITDVLTPVGEFTEGLQPGGSVWQGLEILLWKLIATVILLVIALVGLVRVTGADPVAIATKGAVSGG